MPSVKIPRKSTDTDMTPFVDIAFLILSFFIMATKFKPPEPVEIKTPGSVSSQELPENDAILMTIDTSNRVYFTVLAEKDRSIFDDVLKKVGTIRNLTFSNEQIATYRKTYAVGVPFSQLNGLLDIEPDNQNPASQPGIPVMDTLDNQLVTWIQAAKEVYRDRQKPLKYLIKGDGESKYPTFEAVISALKKNDEFKYNLVTALEDAPTGSALDKANRKGLKTQ
ncbi:MAG TPA: biopolymer transporter ExbD [Chitinophagaceae bacterium]|nr:biopolymer transporter ExbD [Chitinophagaceae bacterium]